MILEKRKSLNGYRDIYFCGMKIFSYRRKRRIQKTKSEYMDYGKVYAPYYNKACMPSREEPEIYNAEGKLMRSFFLRDIHLAAGSCSASKYFIWDKYNIGLDVHFYSHNAMLETMGNPKHRFGFLIETEGIVPDDYLIFQKHPHLSSQFEFIFTNSKFILDTVPNARFAPMNCSLYGGSFSDKYQYTNKTKKCSILSSNKLMCSLHKFRYELAHKCKKEKLCDTFGTFDGGNLVNIDDTLRDYMYSICIENIKSPYLFTERLICAFANQCIPIYLGATEIDKFFNPDGIIQITPETDIKQILDLCTAEEYQRRLPAILDNYERAKKYTNVWDYIYLKYLAELLDKD